MSAELPSTEQIFTETSRLVPLKEHDRYLLDNEATRTAIRCVAY